MDSRDWQATVHGVAKVGHDLTTKEREILMTEVFLVAQSVKNLPAMKETICSAGDLASFPGLGRSPGEENGHPLQYSCLENPMDRGDWQATVHGVARVGHN